MDSKNKVITTEMFKLPIGLEPVIKLYGEEFYGSEKTNKKFIKALSKNAKTEPVISKIEKLVNKKEIIPCFTTKNLSKFIKWKLFAPESVKGQIGFYDLIDKKIILLFNSTMNFFGYASNKLLGEYTIHECIHKFALEKPTIYNSLFLDMETDYYRVLWSRIFSIDKNKLSKNKITKIIKFINKTFGVTTNNNGIVKYFKILDSEFKSITTLSPDEFKKMVTDYIVILAIYIKNINKFYNLSRSFKHIIAPMYLAYSEVLKCKNLNTICIQELFVPNEIIAVYSERYTDSKIYSAINKL